MRILVSGANGFIGRTLCPHLTLLGHSVIPAVRRLSGVQGEHVVGDKSSWITALADCSSVVHLAGRAHIMKDKEQDSLRVFRNVNVDATIKLANLAVEAGVKRFVFMSTVKVNGEETFPGYSLKPDDLPAPHDPYAISKWEAEQRLYEISKKTGLDVVIIRPPLVYGPGVQGNFKTMIQWVRSGVPLPLGLVNNSRSMIALENLVSFTALCADIEASPNAKGQVFLVADGDNVSTSELLCKIAKAYGCSSRLLPIPVRFIWFLARLIGKEAIGSRLLGSLVVDRSKTREVLGWDPPISMDNQLKKMAKYDTVA